jgi:outer membrane protein OmpA-like peptidoglycan-associated protein
MTRRIAWLVCVVAAIVAGCAGPATSLAPTEVLMAQATRSFQRAETDQAVRNAPDEFLAAKAALAEANQAWTDSQHTSDISFKERREQSARASAYRAWHQAEIANAKARSAAAREQIATLKAESAQLDAEMQRDQAEADAARQQRAKEIAEATATQALARADAEEAAKQRALREKAEAELRTAMESAEKDRALQQTAALERARKELEAKLTDAMKEIAQVREEQRGLIISLSDILFDSGKATLLPGTQNKLMQLGKILSAYPDRRIVVEGHTDNTGGDAFNLQLSDARAESVLNSLIAQGVNPEMITAVGFGKSKPVASNDTPSGRQQNRRVEVVVLNPPVPALESGGDAPLPPLPSP